MTLRSFLTHSLLALLGIGMGYGLRAQLAPPAASPTEVRETGHTFTSPLLECDQGEYAFHELRPFVGRVQATVDRQLAQGRATHISVYFRDLNNGPWFGIHEDERFSPASLLKVPILISVLKQAESDAGLLQRPLTVQTLVDDNAGALYPPEQMVEQGKTYTTDELLRFMIAHSDNNAKNVLVLSINDAIIQAIFTELGIRVPDSPTPTDFTTVKDNASFFRVLYNATFLNREMSERALAYLAASQFTVGLVAGVPKGVVVAHKFGQRTLPGGLSQLHDCGIVYYPEHPYLLCVMTRGTTGKGLATVIGDISRQVYGEVDAQIRAGRAK